jgi:hypothetical protein
MMLSCKSAGCGIMFDDKNWYLGRDRINTLVALEARISALGPDNGPTQTAQERPPAAEDGTACREGPAQARTEEATRCSRASNLTQLHHSGWSLPQAQREQYFRRIIQLLGEGNVAFTNYELTQTLSRR